MLLNGLIFKACPACFTYTTQDHLPRDGIAHSGLGPQASISHQENAPPTHTHRQVRGKQFPSEGPSFHITLVCIKLTKSKQKRHTTEHHTVKGSCGT